MRTKAPVTRKLANELRRGDIVIHNDQRWPILSDPIVQENNIVVAVWRHPNGLHQDVNFYVFEEVLVEVRLAIAYDEDVAIAWAEILRATADDHGAPNFAWHMAERGTAPAEVRDMANRWRREGFDHPDWAEALDLFADQVEKLMPGEERAWRR